MLHQSVRLLLLGATVLAVGCSSAPSRFVKEVAGICPSGWQVSASNSVIVLRRETPVWIMGKVSNPPPDPGESVEHYFKTAGSEVHYEVRLRFVPLLPRPEYEKLKAARAFAAARFHRGAAGKEEYTQWQINYENCQVPALFTKDNSIFLDRWADTGTDPGYRIETRFIDVHPPEAASEIEAVIKSLQKVFAEYDNSGT
jgi:hypothetical protein